MESKYDPLSEEEKSEPARDCPDETVRISVDDFYDLLMEQQEQM